MSLATTAPTETDLESGGYAKGVAVAIVCENKDASGQGRVKVNYPWYANPTASYWARVVTPMAGKGRGVYFIPEIHDEVLVAFDRGDLRFPYIIGSLWSGVAQAPENNADGKNDRRVIHSRDGHKLVFDDGAKSRVKLELKDGKKLTIDDDGLRLDDGQGNRVVIDSKGGAVTIEAATKLNLKAPSITIDASGPLDLKSGATLGVKGTLITLN